MKTLKNLMRSAICGLGLLVNTADSKCIDVPDHLYPRVQQILNQDSVSSNRLVSIDSQPALDRKRLTQKGWIAYFNGQERQMISAPDVYRAVSQKDALDSLRKDFNEFWLVTSTRLSYNPNDLGAKVTHNFGSTVVKPAEVIVSEVPVCLPCYVESFIGTDDAPGKGFPYVQAILGTNDKPAQILKTLEQLSERGAEDIRFWTPDQSSRKAYSERAVGVLDCGDWFLIDGYYFGYGSGRSRGVSLGKSPRNVSAKPKSK